MSARSIILPLVAVTLALTACGRQGDLDRPASRGEMATAPVDKITRDNDPAPPRTLPIEGGPSDPSRSAPSGVLPVPYADPR